MDSDYHKKRYETYAAFGLPLEKVLKPVLEENWGSPLTKTSSAMDTIDFTSEKGYVELKCRRPHHCKTDYNSWIFPICKVLLKDKPVRIYYYWDEDKSLYYIDYNQDYFFTSYPRGYPSGSSQQHFWCKREDWTQVN